MFRVLDSLACRAVLKASSLAILFMLSTPCQAELHIPGLSSAGMNVLNLSDKTLARTGLSVNEDEQLDTQMLDALKLSEKQVHEAKVWGLSEEQEKRYVYLMQNRSGLYYKGLNLSPLDILGINARSEDERNKLASLAARQEAQKVSKNIAWNNAFYKAYQKLYNNVPVVGAEFDPSPYSPMAYKPLALNGGDHLYLFINGEEAVTSVLLSLIEGVNSTIGTELNLMFLNADDLAIQSWANRHQIPRQLVVNGQIGLHHGDLNFKTLNITNKKTPLLLLSRAGQSSLVDLGGF